MRFQLAELDELALEAGELERLRQAWEENGGDGLVVLGASRHGILGSQPGRGASAKLANPNFRDRAPSEVVAREEAKATSP